MYLMFFINAPKSQIRIAQVITRVDGTYVHLFKLCGIHLFKLCGNQTTLYLWYYLMQQQYVGTTCLLRGKHIYIYACGSREQPVYRVESAFFWCAHTYIRTWPFWIADKEGAMYFIFSAFFTYKDVLSRIYQSKPVTRIKLEKLKAFQFCPRNSTGKWNSWITFYLLLSCANRVHKRTIFRNETDLLLCLKQGASVEISIVFL